jgi:hypothetical protein
MAKRPAKGRAIKATARAKPSASKSVKRAVGSGKRPQMKGKIAAPAKSKAVATKVPARKGALIAPPSTDIRRAYKSRLLAGYIGTHGADSIPSAKK